MSALTIKMLKTIVENASAERGTFFVVPDGRYFVLVLVLVFLFLIFYLFFNFFIFFNFLIQGESRPTYAHKDSLLITAEYDYETVPQELEGYD